MTTCMAGIIEIVCLYVSITKWKSLPTAAFVFFPLITTDTVIVVFGMLRLASKVLSKSQEKLIALNKCAPRNRWFIQFLKSCPPQKVGFGSSNFVDEMTPLVITQFCISQTVSLMLLDRQWLCMTLWKYITYHINCQISKYLTTVLGQNVSCSMIKCVNTYTLDKPSHTHRLAKLIFDTSLLKLLNSNQCSV